MKKLSLILIIYLLTTSHAYAYLDPGTGSAILTMIVSALTAMGAMSARIKNYLRTVKDSCIKKFTAKKKDKQ